ncbi:MAG: helix-turn-helix domain-containing protein [Bacteroidota bacterium]
MRVLLLYICLFFSGSFVFAQSEDLLTEFQDVSVQLIDTSITPAKAKIIASDYLQKAQKSKEKRYIGRGYYLLAIKNDNVEERIQYLDSAIAYIKEIKEDAMFLTMLYLYRGTSHDFNKDYQQALEDYLTADSLAEKIQSTTYLQSAKYNIAYLKRMLGDYEASEKLFKECLVNLEAEENYDIASYIHVLFQLSSVYYESRNTAKCTEINIQGIEVTKAHDLPDYYYHFVVNEGINLSIQGDYRTSIDSIQKGYSYLLPADQEVADFYLGKSFYALNEKEKALYYFRKIDTVFQNTKDLSPLLRESYVYLINDAKQKKNKEEQLYYTTQLLQVDSLNHTNYKHLSSNIFKKYDTPKYEAERDMLIEELQVKNARITQEKNWIIGIGSMVGLSIIFLVLYYYRQKKQYQKRYNDIMEKATAAPIKEEITVSHAKPQVTSLGIDLEIVNEVLQSLEAFEKGETFLTNQISLKDVAKLLNTNSKYLSKIVNSYKEKNFTTYINDLRIDYLINHVQTDVKYQKYTIRAIAEEIGFSNPEGFSRAFQKRTGLKPSYFIKKARESTKKKQ